MFPAAAPEGAVRKSATMKTSSERTVWDISVRALEEAMREGNCRQKTSIFEVVLFLVICSRVCV